MLKHELDRLVRAFVHEHGDLALEKLDGEEATYERITESIQSLPFLASKKLVVLRNPGAVKQFTENFEQLLATIPETTDVVIVEPKPDKRSSYYKALKKHADFKEFTELDGRALAGWLVEQASAEGGKLSPADAQYLVERVGASQQLLYHELQKLLSYNAEVTRQTIDQLTEPTPQSTVFELLDAAFAGNLKKALRVYEEQRAMKVEPQAILAMIAWQLHVLAIVKAAGQRSPDEIAREAKLSPFVVRKTMNIARKLSIAEVKDLVHRTLLLDIRLKSEAVDADDALQHLIISIAQ